MNGISEVENGSGLSVDDTLDMRVFLEFECNEDIGTEAVYDDEKAECDGVDGGESERGDELENDTQRN